MPESSRVERSKGHSRRPESSYSLLVDLVRKYILFELWENTCLEV
jgi:hypothetical protein